MLTTVQYEALKAWPDTSTTARDQDEKTTMLSLCGLLGLHYENDLFQGLQKVQPACDDAIREYEEAQAKPE